MYKIKIEVTDNIARVTQKPNKITSGTVGLPVEFTFDSRWDGLSKVAVFRAGDIIKTVGNPVAGVTVPWEVLEKPNVWLSVGVYGANEDGSVAIPTIWANVRVISIGVTTDGDDSNDPKPPDYIFPDQNAVQYTEQNLSPEEQEQARKNIGAVSAEVIGNIAIALDSIMNVQEEFIGGGVS